MSGEEDNSQKTHDPSQKRLDEARRRGETIRSTELGTAAAYAGLLLGATVFGATMVQRLAEGGMVLLDQADRLAPLLVAEDSALMGGLIGRAMGAVAPLLLLPAAAVLLVMLAQRALVFAPQKLTPKLSRISILGNAKQKFGRAGLFDFLRNLIKLVIIAVMLVRFLTGRLTEILAAARLSPGAVGRLLLEMMLDFLVLVLAVTLVIAAVDWLWQRFEFLRRQRMTRKEVLDEHKESEGDPHVKHERRSRAQQFAMNQMISDVPKADVVIVNPTHYAVALKWQRGDAGAPVCLAKGVDLIAARIREAAREAGVPIHSDPPTARALHATVEIGEQIRPEHYRAVAASIRFAEKMRRKARPGGERDA